MRINRLAVFAGVVAVLSGFFLGSSSLAQAPHADPQAQRFPIPKSGIAFLTGDAWVQNGQTMRLFGVEACVRGTPFTNAAGVRGDCGEASLAYLASMIRDADCECKPLFQTASSPSAPPVIYVVCQARVGASTLDLGTVMIVEGFAFASFAKDGDNEKPVYMPYMIAELRAKEAHAGLWGGASFSHPYAGLSAGAQSSK
jgi:endonuclease YncB( thermonuclease family)